MSSSSWTCSLLWWCRYVCFEVTQFQEFNIAWPHNRSCWFNRYTCRVFLILIFVHFKLYCFYIDILLQIFHLHSSIYECLENVSIKKKKNYKSKFGECSKLVVILCTWITQSFVRSGLRWTFHSNYQRDKCHWNHKY